MPKTTAETFQVEIRRKLMPYLETRMTLSATNAWKFIGVDCAYSSVVFAFRKLMLEQVDAGKATALGGGKYRMK